MSKTVLTGNQDEVILENKNKSCVPRIPDSSFDTFGATVRCTTTVVVQTVCHPAPILIIILLLSRRNGRSPTVGSSSPARETNAVVYIYIIRSKSFGDTVKLRLLSHQRSYQST